MTEETTNQTIETVETGLTEDEQAELEVLQDTEAKHLTEDDKTRLTELCTKKGQPIGDEIENVEDTTETNVEKDEVIVPEEIKPEEEINVEFDTVIPAEEFTGDWGGTKVYRVYTVETVTELPEANRLWGTLKSELTNGLGSKAKCFVLDFSGTIKAGNKVEVPEHATIRQSHRKIDPAEKKKLENQGKTVRESTFDWLHI